MRIYDSLVEKLLKGNGKVSDKQLAEFREQAASEKSSLQEVAVKNGVVSEKDLALAYAQEIDVPFAELTASELKRDVLQLIPEKVARQYHAVAFDIADDGVVLVAMEDPDDIQAINFIQSQLGKPIRVHITTPSMVQAAIERYGGTNVSSELAKVIEVDDKEKVEDDPVDDQDVAEDSPIAQTVNLIIDYAVKAGASDVHIEPRENFVIVRYRVDGLLREDNKLPRKVLAALVSRIKILANLKIDEHRAPQDGRFKISINNHIYALRVSTLPIVDGEKVVMRILDESSKADTLQQLGYWGAPLTKVQEAIKQPHGMVLVTGPTGSGKSTSLFSVLSMLNNPSVNISTVEDPVEYHIIGVNQVQVNPLAGMTFAGGLRSLLRQDPNIIMVGEIRDGETADLAVQAALTGHLVFSTLHTNNAATCLPRLLDMGVEPFLIASTVRVVVAQRLVRKLCQECREPYKPEAGVLERITKTFGLHREGALAYLHQLEQAAIKDGVGTGEAKQSSAEPGSTERGIVKLWQAHDGGCDHCNHTGYHGRLGIYEVMDNSSAIQNLIVSNGTSEQLESQAIKDGMVTMQLDAFVKALRGQTTVEEIMRATTSED
jgi:type IV pilus assembly protein PilB